MNDIELMPCPFCGGKAEIRDCLCYLDNAVLIRCSKCFVKTEKILIDHPSYTIDGLDESTRYTREQAIEKALKLGAMSIVVSTDAGSEETYEKVKQVKCYKKVWENIRKYNKAAKEKNLVMVKYILIPGFNDNYEEINKWFDEVVKNDVTAVSLSVEQDWYANHQPEFTPEIYEQIAYMEKRAKELNLALEIYCEALAVLKSQK